MNVRRTLAHNDLDSLIEAASPLMAGFDALSDHVIITDADAHILYANKAVEKSTGFSPAEVVGKNPGDLWGGEMSQEFYEKMWQTIKEEKQPFVAEVHNKMKDGRTYWQELHISPILDENGTVKFFIGIEPNITDRKEKEKFRDEFVSILGHQLQSPLVTTKWTLEYLLQDMTLTSEQRDKIMTTYTANESMVDLVANVLTLARLGSVRFEDEEFNLAREIEETVLDVRGRYSSVFISFTRDGERFEVQATKPLAREVFTNLIVNAAEYADKKDGKVLLTLKKDASGLLFSVQNNGLAIPLEDQSRIFSKFFRAANAAGAKSEGSGLGLFIVKLLCQKFGWEVSFKSPAMEDGTGTIFFVKIPA